MEQNNIHPHNKTKPKLSVRLMTYMHEEFIREAITSVLKQKTNFSIEIIIGDDFSSDNTLKICKELEGLHPGVIKVLERVKGDAYAEKRNKLGRLYNFSNTIEHCQGEYIALLDGDDFWDDEYQLQKQVDFLDANKSYAFCYHDYVDVDPQGEIIPATKKHETQDYTSEELQKGKRILPLTICMRNQIKEFPPEFYKSNNGDTFLICLLGGLGSAKYLGDQIKPSGHRIHGSGFWSAMKQIERYKKSYASYSMLYKYFKRVNKPEIAKSMLDLMENNLTWLYIASDEEEGKYFGFLSKEFLYLFTQKPDINFIKNSLKSMWRTFK